MAAVTSSAGVFFSTQVQWDVTSLTSGAELRGPGTVKFGQRKHQVGAAVWCGRVVATAVGGAINFSPPLASTRLQEGLIDAQHSVAVVGVQFVEFGDLEATRRAVVAGRTAAIFVEPLQGEGGVCPATASFLNSLWETCDETGTLLVFYEIEHEALHLMSSRNPFVTQDTTLYDLNQQMSTVLQFRYFRSGLHQPYIGYQTFDQAETGF